MPSCETCGLQYSESPSDKRYHSKVHDTFVNGPRVDLSRGVHLIVPESPLKQREAVDEAARLFQSEMGYDFTSYCSISDDDFREHQTWASIYVCNSRIVGLLIERDWECTAQYSLSSNAIEKQPETLCRRLEVVWVLTSQRKKGIGKKLMEEFLQRLQRPLAVQMPISADGQSLLRSLGLADFWVG